MRTTTSSKKQEGGFTIEQAAEAMGVATATIRNWLKAGYLLRSAQGTVSRESVKKFMAKVAGKEKLHARANKQLKDKHDHQEASDNVAVLIRQQQGEQIGVEYESSLSDSYRNREGIYYTPLWVVKDMFKQIRVTPDCTFLDPCCGSGNFLVEAIRHGVAPENVYGFDTDENAVLIAKQRIKEEFGVEATHVKVGDFLQEAHKQGKDHTLYDLVFTNPPWGKKLEKSAKKGYAALYGCGSSLDTTALFFGAALTLLKPNGYLGFLVQEAFFNITAFESIRRKVLSKSVLRFIDYGKAFKGLLTGAQAVILKNHAPDSFDLIECCVGNKVFNRRLDSFAKNPKHIFNFWTNETEAAVISKLYSARHITLKNRAGWALGIVTGHNKRFCIDKPKAGYVPIYRGADITKAGLREPSRFILDDLSVFQQVAPLEMYRAKEKLIYKFISSNLCFYSDTQQRYILNSANLLVPHRLPLTAEQLATLLNSEIMNWLFKKLFSTHKVLRSDLELLPIHHEYFANHTEFTETSYLNYLQITKTENGTYQIKL